jgi:hypothetical protein
MAVAGAILLSESAIAASKQIWFAPMDWFLRPEVGFGGSADYMKLFSGTDTDLTFRGIAIFKLYPQFVGWATDTELGQIFTELKRRRVALALEAGMLTATEQCGKGIEGFGGDVTPKLAARIARLGGDLAYIAMDEPIGGVNKCHMDMAVAARDAAHNIAAVKAMFPSVRVGDIESLPPSPEMIVKWVEAYRAATGVPLAFFHADIGWTHPWQVPLEKLATAIHARQIPFGVIINGANNAPSDEAWIAQAEAHLRAIESDPKIRPDQLVFQSWVRHPTHIFPASDPGTFSHLLEDYFRTHPR